MKCDTGVTKMLLMDGQLKEAILSLNDNNKIKVMKLLEQNGFKRNDDVDDCKYSYIHNTGFEVMFGYLGDRESVVMHWGDGRTHHVKNDYYSILGFLIHHRLIGFLSFIGV